MLGIDKAIRSNPRILPGLVAMAPFLERRIIPGRQGPDAVYLVRHIISGFSPQHPDEHHDVNLYIHQFMESDDDSALHDHPWHAVSWIIDPGYI